MVLRGLPVSGAQGLVVGVTFKEDCSHTCNIKVADLLAHLHDWGMTTNVVDTRADPAEALSEHGISIRSAPPADGAYDAVILAVPHIKIATAGAAALRGLLGPSGLSFDMNEAFPIGDCDLRL